MVRKAITTYFDSPGAENTEDTLKLAKDRMEELGITCVVVASTTGDTGVKAAEAYKGCRVVVVSHTTGFKSPGTQELTPENRARIEKSGAQVFTGAHAFGGISHAVRRAFSTHVLGDFMANTLRVLGQGMKVAIEISLMATDAGLISTDEEVVAIGGTASGADTAIVVKPAHAHDAFSFRVKEIICKPRL
jgi:hypothetical protein